MKKRCPLCGENSAYEHHEKHEVPLVEPYGTIIVENITVITCDRCKESFLDHAAHLKIEAAVRAKFPNYFSKEPTQKCPTCGVGDFIRTIIDWKSELNDGTTVITENVEVSQCNICFEKAFDAVACRKIEANITAVKPDYFKRKSNTD